MRRAKAAEEEEKKEKINSEWASIFYGANLPPCALFFLSDVAKEATTSERDFFVSSFCSAR
jgi:hypothetical protein